MFVSAGGDLSATLLPRLFSKGLLPCLSATGDWAVADRQDGKSLF